MIVSCSWKISWQQQSACTPRKKALCAHHSFVLGSSQWALLIIWTTTPPAQQPQVLSMAQGLVCSSLQQRQTWDSPEKQSNSRLQIQSNAMHSQKVSQQCQQLHSRKILQKCQSSPVLLSLDQILWLHEYMKNNSG